MTSEIFSGSIALEEGDIDVDFELSLDRVRLAAGTSEIGTWSVTECHVGDAGGGFYQLTAEGETLLFRAADPHAFGEMVARRFRTTGLTERLRSLAQAPNGSSQPAPLSPGSEGVEVAPSPTATVPESLQAEPAAEPSPEEAAPEPEEEVPAGEPAVRWAAVEPEVPAEEPAVEWASVEPLAGPGDEEPAAPWPGSFAPAPLSVGPSEVGRLDAGSVTQLTPASRIEPAASPPPNLPEIDADTIARWRSASDPNPSDEAWWSRQGTAQAVIDPPAEAEEAEQEGGGRFRGSSIQRLTAAVTALKGRPTATEVPEDGVTEPDEGTSVADQIMASQRELRSGHIVKKFTAAGVKKGALWAVALAIVAGLGFATPKVLGSIDWGDDPVPTTLAPTTTVTVAVTTTLDQATTTTVGASDGPVFELPAQDFAAVWNNVAADVSSVLALPPVLAPGPFSQPFTSFLSLEGLVGEDGTLDSYSLTIDPTGPTESDRLGILTLGVAVATAAPDLSGPGRAELLRALGLDVSAPRLEGIDGQVERDGVVYELRYDPDAVRLVLTVGPGGA